MNDFTKEELLILEHEMKHSLYKSLKDKITDMIGNYCEHEKCSDGAALEQVCFKCNKSSNHGWV